MAHFELGHNSEHLHNTYALVGGWSLAAVNIAGKRVSVARQIVDEVVHNDSG